MTSVYRHSLAVAYFSCYLAEKMHLKVRTRETIRGALLHDYFLYDWHEKSKDHRLHGFTHPAKALKNAEDSFNLTPVEKDIIKRHMFPLTPVPPAYRVVAICLLGWIRSVPPTRLSTVTGWTGFSTISKPAQPMPNDYGALCRKVEGPVKGNCRK